MFRRSIATHLLFATMGFATMAAQVIIMRRAIVVFGGNELVAGAVLAGWLGFSGVGNVIAGRFADRIADAERAACIALVALALAIPATTAAAALAKAALGIPPPSMAGLPVAIGATLILMAPIGIAIGIAFVICTRLPDAFGAERIARVYALDAIGAGVGGLLVSLLLIRLFTPLEGATIVAGVLVAGVGIAATGGRRKYAALAILVLLSMLVVSAPRVEHAIAQIQWRGYDPVAQRESLYASIMVTADHDERTLFIDGTPSFSLPRPEGYETLAHLPLLMHPAPKRIAVIGGGISGMIEQWSGLGIEEATFIRLDPEVTALERNALPSNMEALPLWARIVHGDGRRLVERGLSEECRESCLDLLLVNVGAPDTAATGRYYTREFFAAAKRLLKPNGVLGLFLLAPANTLNPEAARVLGIVRRTLAELFPHVVLLPFDQFTFFASGKRGALTDQIATLMKRMSASDTGGDYFLSWVLGGVGQERVNRFAQQVDARAVISPVNTDARPIAYLAGLALWEERAGAIGRGLMRTLGAVRPWMGAAALALLLVVSLILGRRRAEATRAAWALAATGFAAMTFEIVLLVDYQVRYGVLVFRIGLILTAFMVGAGLTAATVARRTLPRIVLPLLLAAIALLLLIQPQLAALTFIGANALMGALTGALYAVAAGRLVAAHAGVGRAAALIEGADHWGAAAGALAASLLLVPLWGLVATRAAAALLLAAALLASALLPRR